MTLQIAIGWDNTAGLADLLVGGFEPRLPGPVPARSTGLLDGHRTIDGHFIYDVELDDYVSASELTATLAQCGLSSAESAEVTVRLPGRTRSTETWNAIIARPNPLWRRGRFEAMAFTLYLIEEITP
ncbi:MAG: hypothetical protein KO463_01090 [Candidatus Methanofastidiosa archaeon]|nr:hypothetical protein [Candidatus Methanofastidiosa archaeon]